MKNFGRAIRDSLHHWPLLLVATLCSVGVAMLWTANIGAMYPVIEMTLKGNSTQRQLAEKVAAAQLQVTQLQEQQRQLTADLAAVGDDEARREFLRAREKSVVQQIDHGERHLSWQRWWLSLAERFLPDDPFRTICVIMVVLVVSTLVKHLLMLANELMVGHVTTTIVRAFRTRIFDQALGYDRRTHQAYGTSGLLASITHSCEMLSTGLMAFFGTAIREPLRVGACLIGAAFVCWRLLLLSLVLAPLLLGIVYWFNRRVKGLARSMVGRIAGFHEVLLEALGNIFTVQAYSMEAEERQRFSTCTREMQRYGMKMVFYTGISKPFTEIVGVGMIATAVCAGAYLIVNQQTHIYSVRICDEPMTASTLMIFFAMLVAASDPLRKMSGVFASIHGGAIAANSLYGMLDHPPVLVEVEHPVDVKRPFSILEARNVSFAYHAGSPVLQDINLTIPFGDTVAILGPNGCGKSTLVQLFGRFYDPVGGSLLLDGVDYRSMSIASIRNRIALVSQHTELFNRTVMENIRYGSPNKTVEEAVEAAKAAHAHEFITRSLDLGYDTVIGQGGLRLSGGQRQRLAMARAILRAPEILVLDESTSQIDMASELQIRQSLAELKRTCTIIIITHREALLELADAVYELRDGRLVATEHRLRISA